MSSLRRWLVVLLIAVASLGACSSDENSDNSPQSGDDKGTTTSGDVPHNNPQSGETGTDGSDTGS